MDGPVLRHCRGDIIHPLLRATQPVTSQPEFFSCWANAGGRTISSPSPEAQAGIRSGHLSLVRGLSVESRAGGADVYYDLGSTGRSARHGVCAPGMFAAFSMARWRVKASPSLRGHIDDDFQFMMIRN